MLRDPITTLATAFDYELERDLPEDELMRVCKYPSIKEGYDGMYQCVGWRLTAPRLP